jgi:hypothetical protein
MVRGTPITLAPVIGLLSLHISAEQVWFLTVRVFRQVEQPATSSSRDCSQFVSGREVGH